MTIINHLAIPTNRASFLDSIVKQALQAAKILPTTLRGMLTPRPINPEKELARAARREAARRAADNLIR